MKQGDDESNGASGDEPEDVETALKNEILSIKEEKSTERRFQVVDSGAKNCVFIKTTVKDPVLIVHKYLSDVYQSKTAKSRYIMRLHPVIATCHTDINKFSQLVEDTVTQYMATGNAKTYCILIKVRNNNKFGKGDIFPVMRRLIQDMNPGNDFDDKNPDYVLSVDVIKSICCLSVMADYYKFRKYNIQEIVKVIEGSNSLESDKNMAGEQATSIMESVPGGKLEKDNGSSSNADPDKVVEQTSGQFLTSGIDSKETTESVSTGEPDNTTGSTSSGDPNKYSISPEKSVNLTATTDPETSIKPGPCEDLQQTGSEVR